MPPIMAPEERARSVQALLAEKPSPRGFVAAVPTSPTPLSPFSPPALQPPPPSHYLRNSSRNSEGSDLFRKRSEIYTRVQRVLPPASHAEDSGSGLLFGSDFHADWSNTRLRRSPLSSPRFVAASPIHASPAHTPAAPLSALSAQSPSVTAYSKSNAYDTPSTRARDEDDTPEVSAPGSPSEAASKERPSRRPLRTLLRERLTVKVRSRSVEGASAAQPASSMDDPPRHSTELSPSFSQQFALVWPPSPDSSASSAAYESSTWSSEADSDKKSVSSSASHKGLPHTPPSPMNINLRTPPSAPISLLEAQKVRRAKAFDHFTRYSETTPFQFQRGASNNHTAAAVPVPVVPPVITVHSAAPARESPTEAPVQMQWASAIEVQVHRVNSVPTLKQQQHHAQPRSQSNSQLQPQPQQPQLVTSEIGPTHSTHHSSSSPPPSTTTPPPLLSPTSMTATATPVTEASVKRHRASGHRKSTGMTLPSVGSLKAILRPRSHSKAAMTGPH